MLVLGIAARIGNAGELRTPLLIATDVLIPRGEGRLCSGLASRDIHNSRRGSSGSSLLYGSHLTLKIVCDLEILELQLRQGILHYSVTM